ncbi:unnamed protein product [Paramecium pentaurelia]|uniref:Uncharacterized protein n=1 Tax=Paramecium pentaurelia TaxID=43138 RepID=A0A8S1U6I5_9CILI|nr:unnamed protein product [Paramecium pentaurelia]
MIKISFYFPFKRAIIIIRLENRFRQWINVDGQVKNNKNSWRLYDIKIEDELSNMYDKCTNLNEDSIDSIPNLFLSGSGFTAFRQQLIAIRKFFLIARQLDQSLWLYDIVDQFEFPLFVRAFCEYIFPLAVFSNDFTRNWSQRIVCLPLVQGFYSMGKWSAPNYNSQESVDLVRLFRLSAVNKK